MGDSLTRGESGGSQSVQLATNYPFYFKKLTQADVTNQSQGGITAQGFWNTFASTYDYTPFDCAVIFLGTNGGLTDTVETDCNVDYTQNADTNTGCYGKIIGRIKATAPNCKIFVIAGVNDYVRRATKMNPAVRALAEFYDVGLVDVENCIMSDSGGGETAERYLYRPIDGIHYNRLGYMTLANMIYDSMSDFMSKHLTKYDD
jgi:lysophospholipase L1-like esterase